MALLDKSKYTLEDEIQERLTAYIRRQYPHIIFTCNGLFNNKSLVERSVKMGYQVGIPDLFILNHKLFIELKSEKGKLSDKQIQCQLNISDIGYTVMTCYGYDEAKALIDEFEYK